MWLPTHWISLCWLESWPKAFYYSFQKGFKRFSQSLSPSKCLDLQLRLSGVIFPRWTWCEKHGWTLFFWNQFPQTPSPLCLLSWTRKHPKHKPNMVSPQHRQVGGKWDGRLWPWWDPLCLNKQARFHVMLYSIMGPGTITVQKPFMWLLWDISTNRRSGEHWWLMLLVVWDMFSVCHQMSKTTFQSHDL